MKHIIDNIPIYRAKKIDSDEYVKGYLLPDAKTPVLIFHSVTDLDSSNGMYVKCIHIDKTTLSIHFPDMLDSQGNKIFASLSEDGKGGDILKNDEYEFVAKYSDCGIILKSKSGELFMGAEYIEINNLKVTGIQK